MRLGVVGIGGIFNGCHAPALLKHPEVELVSVCDIVPAKAEKFAAANGIKNVYSDYRQLIAKDNLDAINICTSNRFHSEIAIAALKAGLHVFTEKPDAINAAEAKKMAQAAAASGKTLMAMRNNRFRPEAQFLKRFIAEGQAGDLYTGRCGWIRRRGIPGKGGWFTTKELSGGGPLIDLGVHMVDLAIWLMGNPRPVSVVGATYNKFANANLSDSVHSNFGEAKSDGVFDVEDLATGFIRFANGATLQIEFSWASNIVEEVNFVELRGSKAGFTLRHDDLGVYTEVAGVLCDLKPRIPADTVGGHARHLNHFIDVLQGRAEPINRPEHGVDIIKILMALYESAQSGKEVTL
ncbi:MAG: Gfo/Idh/MocA family oxidoreductase [Phycisphaerae bacterium]